MADNIDYPYLGFLQKENLLPRLFAIGERLAPDQHLFQQPPFEWTKQLIPDDYFNSDENWYGWLKFVLRNSPSDVGNLHPNTFKYVHGYKPAKMNVQEAYSNTDMNHLAHNTLSFLFYNYPFVKYYFDSHAGGYVYSGENIGTRRKGWMDYTYAHFLGEKVQKGQVILKSPPVPILTEGESRIPILTYTEYGYEIKKNFFS